MSMIAQTVTGTLFTLIALPALAQTTTTPAPPNSAPEQPATTTQPAPAQYPAQPAPAQYPAPSQYPVQPSAQPAPAPYPAQPAPAPYPAQPAAQPYPQQPAAQPNVAYAPAYPAQDNIQLQPDPLPPPVARGPRINRFSFGARVGAQLGGSPTYSADCSGSCSGFTSTPVDASFSATPAFGVDFLFKLGELVRIGPSLTYTHTMDVEPDGRASEEFGSLITIDGVVEAIPRVAPSVWLVPRAQLGFIAYNATGSTADDESNSKASCFAEGWSGCDSLESPHIGFDIGGSFGVMFAVADSVRLRFDALAEYYSFDIAEIGGSGTTITANVAGSRYLAFGGVEL